MGLHLKLLKKLENTKNQLSDILDQFMVKEHKLDEEEKEVEEVEQEEEEDKEDPRS